MNRKALSCFSSWMPDARGATCQLRPFASSPCFSNLACSRNLSTPMYQVPSDMMTRMIRVALAMTSPCDHSAESPYGLEAGGGGAAHALAVASQAAPAAEANTRILLFELI